MGAVYGVLIECSVNGVSKRYYLLSADTKGRLVVFLKTMLLFCTINIVLLTKRDGSKAIFTILSLSSTAFFGVITFNKNYKVLCKLPFKNAKYFCVSYLVSYCLSIFVMFLMTIHAISVAQKQTRIIYCYVGLSFIWLLWSQLYNNEISHFISELNEIPSMKIEKKEEQILFDSPSKILEIKREKQMPTTYASLHLLNEILMISAFMTFVICFAMAFNLYDGARDAGNLFFLAIYLMLSCIMFVNSFIAILSMQSKNQKVHQTASFEPVFRESLLSR